MITKTAQTYYNFYTHTQGLEKTALSIAQVRQFPGKAFQWLRNTPSRVYNSATIPGGFLNDFGTVIKGGISAGAHATLDGAVATGKAVMHPVQTAMATPAAVKDMYNTGKSVVNTGYTRGKEFLKRRINEEKSNYAAMKNNQNAVSAKERIHNAATTIKNDPKGAAVNAKNTVGAGLKNSWADIKENFINAGGDMIHNTANNLRTGSRFGNAVSAGAKQTLQQHPGVSGFAADMVDPLSFGPVAAATLATGGIPLGLLPVSPLKRVLLGHW